MIIRKFLFEKMVMKTRKKGNISFVLNECFLFCVEAIKILVLNKKREKNEIAS